MQIVTSISKNSVKHVYTVELAKTFQFQGIQFIQTFLIQLIQFSISIDVVSMQLNVKTVLYYTIQFSVVEFQCQKQFHFKQFSSALAHSSNVSTQF